MLVAGMISIDGTCALVSNLKLFTWALRPRWYRVLPLIFRRVCHCILENKMIVLIYLFTILMKVEVEVSFRFQKGNLF